MNRYAIVFVLLMLGVAAIEPSIIQHALNNILRAFSPFFEPVFWLVAFVVVAKWLWNGGGGRRRR